MSSSPTYRIGIVGATGAVGAEILSVLYARRFPIRGYTGAGGHTKDRGDIDIATLKDNRDTENNADNEKKEQKVLKTKKEEVEEEGIGIHLYASHRSAGKVIESEFGRLTIEEFTVDDARQNCDIIFLAVSGSFALEYGPQLVARKGTNSKTGSGNNNNHSSNSSNLSKGGEQEQQEENIPYVIDNSSAFRYHDSVPLVIPEINSYVLHDNNNQYSDKSSPYGKRLIANPNCTTAIAAMALYPIHAHYKIKKLIMSTYQAASGAGAEGMEELKAGMEEYLLGKTPTANVFQHPLPFNLIPQIDKFLENKYTKEEMKVVWETSKIFDSKDINVSCTCVRVPTLRAHAESIVLETECDIDPDAVRELLAKSPGVTVKDKPDGCIYPMPLTATAKLNIEVGRIRQSLIFGKKGIELFVCGDQLLRGAASNAVFIAESLINPEMYAYTKKNDKSKSNLPYAEKMWSKNLSAVGLVSGTIAIGAVASSYLLKR